MQRNNKDNEMNPNKEERLNDNQNQENQEDGIRRKRKRVTKTQITTSKFSSSARAESIKNRG